MAEFVGEGMLQTWSSAATLDASTVEKGWAVLLTLGILVGAVVAAGALAHRADTRAKNVFPKYQDLDRAVWTIKKRDSTRSGKPAKLQKVVMESETSMLERSLPSVLRSKSFVERVKDEMKHYHRWMGVVYFYSPSFPRILRITSLATNIVTMLFVQAITYKLSNPDDGSCELCKSEVECLAASSAFQTGESKCFWMVGFRRGSCHFKEPSDSFKVVLFVSILAAIISTPISLCVEWLIMNVLCAHTSKYKSKVSATAHTRFSHRKAFVSDDDNANTVENVRPSMLPTSLEDDMTHFMSKLKQCREELVFSEKKEFDGSKNTCLYVLFLFPPH
jgi:hypothetical protein